MGKLRSQSVGIFKGSEISHVAPPAKLLNGLMNDLFEYYKNEDDPILIKSCVIHYELEFIHPFMDGNGRMGRLWQTLILLKTYPIFEYLPFETIIKDNQSEYYSVLEKSNKEGKSTRFIEFILTAIDEALIEILKTQTKLKSPMERLNYYLQINNSETFTRKDYLNTFKEISTATASQLQESNLQLIEAIKKMDTKAFHKKRTGYNPNTGHNLAWTLYHLAEDEVHHRGQISILRKLYKNIQNTI